MKLSIAFFIDRIVAHTHNLCKTCDWPETHTTIHYDISRDERSVSKNIQNMGQILRQLGNAYDTML